MVHSHTVHLPLGALLIHLAPCTMCVAQVMGGMVDLADDPVHLGVVQIYNTRTRQWRVMSQEMPIQGGMVFFDGSRILVLGGATSGERPPSTIPTKPNPKREAAIRRQKRRELRKSDGWREVNGLGEVNVHYQNLLSSSEDDDDDADNDESDEDEEDENYKQPATWDLTWEYNSETTAESWALNVATEEWKQLASAPKPHLGWYLYRDRVTNTAQVAQANAKKCAECLTPLKGRPQTCPCKAVSYCSKSCQRRHWRHVHKVLCTARVRNCRDVIRAADDPALNYCVATDTWIDDPTRQAMTDHNNASEIVCVALPF